MKRLTLLFVCWLALGGVAAAQYPRTTIGSILPATASGSLDAAEEAVTLNLLGFPGVGIQVTGTFTGTLTFEVSMDGTNYQTVNVTPPDSTSAATSSTATGIWSGSVVGYSFMRVRMSAYTSGTAVVSVAGTLGGGSGSGGGGGGGGAATTGADDASIPAGTTNDIANSFSMVFDGAVWRRLTIGTAGTASTQVLTVQGITSGTPLDVTCSSGCSGGTQYAEDAVHASGNTGTLALGVRRDTAASSAGTDGDNATFNFSSAGRLWTSATIDAALPVGTNIIGGINVNLAGSAAAVGTGVNGSTVLRVNEATDSQLSVDAAAIRTATESAATSLDTIEANLSTDAVQGNAVIATGPQKMLEAKDQDGSALPNSVTEGQSVRAAGSLNGVQYAMLVNEDGSAVGSIAQSGTWTMQPGNTANTTPWLTSLNATAAAQGCTPGSIISANSVNETEIKGSAGQLYMLNVTNIGAAAVYFKIYNDTAANTDETDTPIQRFVIPGSATGAGNSVNMPAVGIVFSAGITFRITSAIADNSTGAIAASEVLVSYCYK